MPKPECSEQRTESRREFLRWSVSLGLWAGLWQLAPPFARASGSADSGSRTAPVDLTISSTSIGVGERTARATTVNGSVPGPLVRLTEGEHATLNVTNRLGEDSSIHWHGLLVPPEMDGVPKVSFPGIRPEETFTYRFPVVQSGTYWYHSHSGLQEQTGVYGPMILDPADGDPYGCDRDYVVMLSDWTFEDPYDILANLKKMGGYYNFQRRTLASLAGEKENGGLGTSIRDRLRWGRMRMDPTDIADITGYTYTYLMNGMTPGANWTGIFRPGERVRLRFINAGAASYFDIRIPGLSLEVIEADGQPVQPVRVEELRIAIAETYDVIVQPPEDRAYTVFAEAMDRSGFASGTLAPRTGMTSDLPARRKRPVRSMADMGMAGHNMSGMQSTLNQGQMQADPDSTMGGHGGMSGHGGMNMGDAAMQTSSGHASQNGSPGTGESVAHGPDHHGPGNTSVAATSSSRLSDPGVGLSQEERRVLVYSDLRAMNQNAGYDRVTRELELHLTGNMERYMWSFDGKAYWEVDGPIEFTYGEVVKLTFVNDTMMEHPIHLHGMWMVLDVGAGRENPKKHTINVKPAERVSVLVHADAPGKWAFHCHILYHMEMGMFRVVHVTDSGAEGSS